MSWGVAKMSYCFYPVSSSGHRHPPKHVSCPSDFHAMAHARTMLGADGVIEIWRGTRLVGTVGLLESRWAQDGTSDMDATVQYSRSQDQNRALGSPST